MPARVALPVLAAALGLGCDGPASSYSRYIPEESAARRALVAALSAWQQGRPPGVIASRSASIQVVDSSRNDGRRLQRFEILGELAADHARCFAVRLSLAGPEETRVARYLVVGIDPLLVIRQEDYDLISHWEHATDPPSGPAEADATESRP